MRLTRRAALAGLGTLAVAPDTLAQAPETGRTTVTISARAIAAFEPRNPEKTRFGKLAFRSGLVLSGDHSRFGGLSGLWRGANGTDLVAVTDNGFWLTAKPAYGNGRLSGLDDAELAPILGTSGRPLPAVQAPRRAGDAAQVVADTTRLRTALDWTPRHDDVDAIVRSALDWEKRAR